MPEIVKELEALLRDSLSGTYLLRLYVTGNTPQSCRAVANIKAICERFLQDRYELEVIDLYQQPELAKGKQIIVAPTLVRQLPLPVRRLIGDLSNTQRVLLALDLKADPQNQKGVAHDQTGAGTEVRVDLRVGGNNQSKTSPEPGPGAYET